MDLEDLIPDWVVWLGIAVCLYIVGVELFGLPLPWNIPFVS